MAACTRLLAVFIWLTAIPLARTAMATAPVAPAVPAKDASAPVRLYDEVTALVSQHFFDRSFRGLPWPALVASRRSEAEKAADPQGVKNVVNDLLLNLKSSHTVMLGQEDQDYWALRSIFSGKVEGERYLQAGAWFEHRGKRLFVRNVFPDGPLDRAGIARGDEIISVDDQPPHPVLSFSRTTPGNAVRVAFRHLPWDQPKVVNVIPVRESVQENLLRAMQRSAKTFSAKGKTIGYIWLPTGSHPRFRETLEAAARNFQGSTQAMVLDLRDGFGGADLTYLDPFLAPDGKTRPLYDKPLVAIINEGTRSGKEWLAWAIRQRQRGRLVGTRTAGAFLGGRLFELSQGEFVLYLAVKDMSGLGVDLEGRGVEPDIEVRQALMYAAGGDEPLKVAVETAAAM